MVEVVQMINLARIFNLTNASRAKMVQREKKYNQLKYFSHLKSQARKDRFTEKITQSISTS